MFEYIDSETQRAHLYISYIHTQTYIYIYHAQVSKVCSLCNQAGIVKNDAGGWDRIGESTEAALKVLADKMYMYVDR